MSLTDAEKKVLAKELRELQTKQLQILFDAAMKYQAEEDWGAAAFVWNEVQRGAQSQSDVCDDLWTRGHMDRVYSTFGDVDPNDPSFPKTDEDLEKFLGGSVDVLAIAEAERVRAELADTELQEVQLRLRDIVHQTMHDAVTSAFERLGVVVRED
jgi:hypothetical protein